MKKTVSLLLAILSIVILIVPMATTVSAASTTGFNILSSSNYAKTYTLSTSGKTIPYTNKNLTTRGTTTYGASSSAYIDNSSDELYIIDVGITNGTYWAYVSYPVSSKRVYAYIPLSALTSNNGTHAKTTSTGKFYCSPREGYSNNSSYYVEKGDTVYIIATSGSKCQILYPTSGDKWRLAWCNSSDYQQFCGNINTTDSSVMTDVTAYFAGKTITLQSVQNGKYLCSDTNYSNTPAMCNRSNETEGTTYTVSSITSDGWVGFKSKNNNKYLSARSGITDTPVQSVAGSLQSWECFRIYKKGNDYYIKAQVNNKFLCVRVDKSGAPVQAYANAASTWERFTIRFVEEQSTSNTFIHPMKNFSKKYTQWCVYPSYVSGSRTHHAGVDYISDDPTVYAFTNGTVVAAGFNNANGNYVLIEHTISGKKVYSFYGHLDSYNVSVNQTVSAGTPIGIVGETGSSSHGIVHLHFAIIDYKWTNGGVYGYVTEFSGNKVNYENVNYYNPYYVIAYGKLPD